MKPWRFPSRAPAGRVSVTGRRTAPPAGTSTVAGAERPGADTVHVPAPLPASRSSTPTVRVAGARTRPKLALAWGESSGDASAAVTSIRPEPTDSGSASTAWRGAGVGRARRQLERRADVSGSPQRMALVQQRGCAGNGRRGHARPVPDRVPVGYRRQHALARRGDVGLESQRDRRRPERREGRGQAAVARAEGLGLIADRDGGLAVHEQAPQRGGHAPRDHDARNRTSREAARVGDPRIARSEGDEHQPHAAGQRDGGARLPGGAVLAEVHERDAAGRGTGAAARRDLQREPGAPAARDGNGAPRGPGTAARCCPRRSAGARRCGRS